MCCGYLLESPRRGDSNKYPQHMFLGVNKGKNFCIPYWYILGFFIMANPFKWQNLGG